MKRILVAVALAAALSVPATHAVLADDPHANGSTGQPSQSCQVTPGFPGNTGNSPGSAFNGSAGNVYANPTSQGGMSSGNPNVVAQYDVACFQQSQH
jgi:hypothetical protein